jgi:hypothetical protein
MGRDIYVESKHLNYYGSKSSDLIMAFDRFFWKFPKHSTSEDEYFDDDGYYCVKLSKKEIGQVVEFIKDDISLNSKLYRNADELLERINNIYIRMMPNDFVEVWTC